MKQITKLEPKKFSVKTLEAPQQPLILDFSPIIEQFKLSGAFCLLHWQARPKPYRQWGIYYSSTDSYYSLAEIAIRAKCSTLQLDDATASTLPNAVLYYPNSIFDGGSIFAHK